MPTKTNPTGFGSEHVIDGVTSENNLPWAQCGHYSGNNDAPAYWSLDLGAEVNIVKVKL